MCDDVQYSNSNSGSESHSHIAFCLSVYAEGCEDEESKCIRIAALLKIINILLQLKIQVTSTSSTCHSHNPSHPMYHHEVFYIIVMSILILLSLCGCLPDNVHTVTVHMTDGTSAI
jgi:hypothetical protein